ncbi:MAG: hypothetical protein RIE53_01045 [Rhodothermales bacterium]
MATAKSLHRSEVIKELDKIPSAKESFRQGWSEAQSEETHPVSELWEDTDAA